MQSRTILRATSITFVLVVAISSGLAEEAHGHGSNIHVGNYYFCDPTYTNQVCDRAFAVSEEVAWEVFDGIHTITGCDENFVTCPPPSGGFELGITSPGELKLYAFGAPGIYAYRCNYHPDQMRGRIFVGVDTPPPTLAPTTAPTPITSTQPSGSNDGVATVVPSGGVGGPAVQPAAALAGGGGPSNGSVSIWFLAMLGLGGAFAAAALALIARRRLS